MAAGQQKKRLISSGLPEHYREKKKKKSESSQYTLNLRSQIYLEWDNNQMTALAKREQIGIKWRDMAPYIDSVHKCPSGLADVICVPKEIYSLSNLMDVLSYEVWATCLSGSEKKLLTQFLPSGTGTEQVIQSLLAGENHHFGNPSLKWSSSLCSGSLHPDDLLRRDRQIKFNKKQYYPELNKYHANMLEGLKILKTRWISCNDPEKLWRKALIKPKESTSSPASSEKAKEMPQKTQIRNVDVTKFMSYIKITKKQQEAIKNLKNSGDGIQAKSLSRVLGDTSNYPVHPYEELEEEDKLRLHEHWLQVVNKDLPVAYEAHKEKKSQREELLKCLEQELFEKRASMIDEVEISKIEILPQEIIKDGEYKNNPHDILISEDAFSGSINSDLGPTALDKESVAQGILILEDSSPLVSQFNVKENFVECPIEPKKITSSAEGIWQAVDEPLYNRSSSLSLAKLAPVEECQANIIDLDRGIAQSDNAAMFSLCNNQRVANHFPSFPKAPEILSSYPQQINRQMKQPEMHFLMGNRSFSETSQFPLQFHDQQTLNKSIFSNGSYPNQELFPPTNGDLNIINHNWYPNDQRMSNNTYWSGVESSSVNSDGSLFSVLSSCGNIQSQLQNNNMINPEPLMEARNYGPNNENIYNYAPLQFNTSSSHEALANNAATLPIPWINYQTNQNSSMQDSFGKPFVRPWNQ